MRYEIAPGSCREGHWSVWELHADPGQDFAKIMHSRIVASGSLDAMRVAKRLLEMV